MPPDHHKEIAKFLKEKVGGNASVTAYRDNNNARPIPIGEFGASFYSTIGAFDMSLQLPGGLFEFPACGNNKWLPNAVASSIYWLSERNCTSWPLVCEDVVKHNVKSTYRHMAYIPSPFGLEISTGQKVHWLLGVPVTDNDIGVSGKEVLRRTIELYPEWLFNEGA